MVALLFLPVWGCSRLLLPVVAPGVSPLVSLQLIVGVRLCEAEKLLPAVNIWRKRRLGPDICLQEESGATLQTDGGQDRKLCCWGQQ